MITIVENHFCKYLEFEPLGKDSSFICRTTLRQPKSVPIGWDSFAAVSGIDPASIRRIRQTHSDMIRVFHPGVQRGSDIPEADGMILTGPGIFGMIRTADCVPVIIVNPARKITALVHAGWKGTCDRITRKAILALLEISPGDPADLVVFAGPCIHACCYQVGTEVIEAFLSRGHDLEGLVEDSRLDLVQANLRQAQEMGAGGIAGSGFCTSCHPDLFHSYRRNRTRRRMLTMAGFIY